MCNKKDLAKAILEQNNGSVLVKASDLQRMFGWGRLKTDNFIASLPIVGPGKERFYLDVVDKLIACKK